MNHSIPTAGNGFTVRGDVVAPGVLEKTTIIDRKLRRVADHDSFEAFGRSIATATLIEAHKLTRQTTTDPDTLAEIRTTITVEITLDDSLGGPMLGDKSEPKLRIAVDMPTGPVYVNV